MNTLEFKGRITNISDVQSGETKNGAWKSVDFVVSEPDGQYPQSGSFRIFGEDKVEKFNKYNSVGDDVIVSFNLKSREHEGRFYNSLDAWKVYKENATQTNQTTNDEEDDLPF